MRILVLAIGRSRDRALGTMIEGYRRRLPWPLELRELESRQADPGRRQEDEARLLESALPAEDRVIVALDEHGEEPTSVAFAARLGQWRDQGRRCVVFLIGGADGHRPTTLHAADFRLALGRMTWPHELVRLLLVEQLYRASTILSGHPYHRA